jgi:drug/metabolite transporter (DMT)-like permease
MFWNLTLSKFYLKKNLLWQQIAGAVAVVTGVIVAAFPANGGPGLFDGV